MADQKRIMTPAAAIKAGATGYLLKHAWLQSFAQAVLQVVNGGAGLRRGRRDPHAAAA